MNAPVDPRVLPGEDLLRWYKPETPLEEALATALIEARERVAEYDERAAEVEELNSEIMDLKNERDEYKEFYENVEGAFQDSSVGYWPGASPTSGAFVAAVCEQLRGNAGALEALELAAGLIGIARQYFPKSIQHPDRFTLENTCAAINRVIRHD